MSVPDNITVVNKDTFWTLIDKAKEHPDGPSEWLMDRLVGMGPVQARTFDTLARVYMDAAYQYGLWTAASVMEKYGCSDDGFIDFRAWLVGQGRDVYMAALKDPDSLADAPDYQSSQFDSLARMGDYAYENLTGRDAYEDFDPAQYHALEAEVKPDIVYGEPRLRPSSPRFMSWGMVSNGLCLTAQITGLLNQGEGSTLSDILIPDAPEKYFLSPEQTERLLFKSLGGRRDRESTIPQE